MAVPRVIALRFLAVALFACPVTAFAGAAGSVLISVGEAQGERWDDGQPQLGIDISLGPRSLPLQLTAYAAGSRWSWNATATCAECSGSNENTIGEAGVGVRGVWRSRIAHVSLAVGPAWSEYHYEEAPAFSVTNRGTGWWAGGDALIRTGSHLGIGAGARHTRIEYDPHYSAYMWGFHGSIGWLWPGAD